MNYTAKELLEEMRIVWEMLGNDDPNTYHYLNQLLISIEEEEEPNAIRKQGEHR